jgi:hypothetical protein
MPNDLQFRNDRNYYACLHCYHYYYGVAPTQSNHPHCIPIPFTLNVSIIFHFTRYENFEIWWLFGSHT